MRILFFAHLRELAGVPEIEIEADGLDIAALWDVVTVKFPALASHRHSVRISRNCQYAEEDARFHRDDEVALIPPVSGG